jgi:hypothetical protein
LYVIAVQNAVPHKFLGVATSTTAFLRFIGGSFGLALFGTIMTNNFAANLLSAVPATLKSALGSAALDTISHNPQALVSPEAQTQLKGLISSFSGQNAAVFDQFMQAMRHSLNSALTQVFEIALAIILVALVSNVFLPEIPLRKRHGDQAAEKPAGEVQKE